MATDLMPDSLDDEIRSILEDDPSLLPRLRGLSREIEEGTVDAVAHDEVPRRFPQLQEGEGR